jgi:hypothetical protein
MYNDTNSGITPKTVTFQAVTSATAQKVRFTLDGKTVATVTGPGTTFNWTWTMADAMPDGTYSVAAQAVDSATGNIPQGDPYLRSVVVNRYRPTGNGYSPAQAGRNPLFNLVPEIEWYPAVTTARVDRDVIAFDIWRYPNGALGSRAQTVMGTTTNWFADLSYPTGKTSITYAVWPSDYDNGGTLRYGTSSGQSPNVMATNTRPVAPTAATVTRSGTQVTLNWTQSTTGGAQPNKGDADTSDCVDFYRIYRKAAGDNSAWVYASRVDRTPFGNAVSPCGLTASEFSNSILLSEADSSFKQYRITAVDRKLAESTLVTPTNCATTC